jgi:hypothetical protein
VVGLSGSSLLLEQVQLLEAPGQPARRCDVLIEAGALAATDREARQRAEELGLGGLTPASGGSGPPWSTPIPCWSNPRGG